MSVPLIGLGSVLVKRREKGTQAEETMGLVERTQVCMGTVRTPDQRYDGWGK